MDIKMTIPKRGEVKYQWALNGEGKVVKISDITPENRHQQFTCINCHCEAREMSPVLSKEGKRQNHFRHKADACSYESYLHAVCKEILKYQFEHKTQWLIQYEQEESCSLFDSCTLRTELRLKCLTGSRRLVKEVDLKQLYDTCTIEKEYKGYRADVLLTNSQDSSVEPLFIEVAYKHLCEDEKIQSGIRIIEILVNNEADAERELIESETIRFWGFERHIEYAGHELNRIQFINRSNRVDGIIDKPNCKCVDRDVACFYEVKSKGNLYRGMVEAIAAQNVPNFKTCATCRNKRVCMVPAQNRKSGVLFSTYAMNLDLISSINCAMFHCPISGHRKYELCEGTIHRALSQRYAYSPYTTWIREEEPTPQQTELLFD